MKSSIRISTVIFLLTFLLQGCGVYSFSGTSIQSDVKTICVMPVVNRALKTNPTLANQLTEELTEKYRRMTRLETVDEDGDMNVEATIESYDVRAAAITANEVASTNRLTITVKVKFTNELHPEDNLEQSFAAYEDYNSENSLDAVESSLCDAIIEKLVDDIFNATVAQW